MQEMKVKGNMQSSTTFGQVRSKSAIIAEKMLIS
jgi:hypothetical protein